MKIWIEINEEQLEAVKAVLNEGSGKKQKVQEKTGKEEKQEKAADSGTETGGDYESMKAADLYKLCCERGISSQCKKRDKASLIAVLKANDAKAEDEEEAEGEDWEDEEEVPADPYEGKTAKQLYKMCVDRGIAAKPKQKPETYVKLLKVADAGPDEEEEDEDWEID